MTNFNQFVITYRTSAVGVTPPNVVVVDKSQYQREINRIRAYDAPADAPLFIYGLHPNGELSHVRTVGPRIAPRRS